MPDNDVAAQIPTHRGYLLRVAMLQLRDRPRRGRRAGHAARGAQGAAGFSGKSSLKTWLTGILKHKIVDAIRRKSASRSLSPARRRMPDRGLRRLVQGQRALGKPAGGLGRPGKRRSSRQQFFDIMEFCLEKLPPNTARVFMMREVMELDSDEICKELTITANNLWVILYRARMALRQCLEQNWFARAAAAPDRRKRRPPSVVGHSFPARTRAGSSRRCRTRACRSGSALARAAAPAVCDACTRFERQLRFLRTRCAYIE